ncbi:hypothetical protein MPSEU_000513200 [Mayamaea pseudoterrestris]|nr:hypothetical protein MPSEU_000513200 [Mayamaea pseudoterrestris]
MSDEANSLLPRVPRQQYHYLYGSTTNMERYEGGSTSSPNATDQDSLVGEALVSTDNEQDMTPVGSDGDIQQLLMTNENGVQLLGGSGNDNHETHKVIGPFTLQSLDCIRLRRSQLWLFIITLAGAAIILVVFQSPIVARRSKGEALLNMPFARVDREDFGDPAAGFIDKSLFDPSLINRRGRKEFIFPFPTGSFWTNLVLAPTADRGLSYPVVAYPYAYAWSHALLQLSYSASHRKEEPKMIHDYFFPDLTLTTQEGILNRHITYFDALSVTLRYTTQGGKWETYLVQGSPYVTIRYENSSPVIHAFSTFAHVGCNNNEASSSKNLDANHGNRRLGEAATFGVCAWEEDSAKSHRILRGVQFRIFSQEGMEWILFSSEPIELQYDLMVRSAISSINKFKGVLRIAFISGSQGAMATSGINASAADNDRYMNSSLSTGLQRLIYHAGVYPISGDVSWSFRSSDTESILAYPANSILSKSDTAARGKTATTNAADTSQPNGSRIGRLTFQFATGSFTPSSSASAAKPLLMLALPHHAEKLPSYMQLGRDQFDLVYECIKGPMRPMIGRIWSYDETLPSMGLDDFDFTNNERKGYLDTNVRLVIIDSLKEDITLALPTITENVYGFGKQTARLAQLTHIAYMLQQGKRTDYQLASNGTFDGETAVDDEDAEVAEVYQKSVKLLRTSLEHFLNNSVSDMLVFDDNLGGLVTIDGLRDTELDFGNGRYNDHHFHFGYLLYACAIMGSLDRDFVIKYSDAIDAIYLDIAHDTNFKSEKSGHIFLPGARHKMWYDGHSFASGLFPFGNGKSQESSSEAINGYFGAYLWSLVKHGAIREPNSDVSPQTDFVRLLMATELRGAQTYWHMMPPSGTIETHMTSASATVFSPTFSRNYMVGNMGMLDATSTTWFGTSSLYVHMINEMPVTAATSTLFSPAFVEGEYINAMIPLGEVEMAWRGYVVCNQAMVNSREAWISAQKLQSRELDSGISKSQILYFISTRPSFNPLSIPRLKTSSKGAGRTENGTSACSAHDICRKAGLVGFCCPSPEGITLRCCASSELMGSLHDDVYKM